jgi:hypothetical protein
MRKQTEYLEPLIQDYDHERSKEITRKVKTAPIVKYIERQKTEVVRPVNKNESNATCRNSLQHEIRNNRRQR